MTAALFRAFLLIAFTALSAGQYQPTWDSLDARPLPAWYDDSKFGIFMHWGVFSVPSFGSEWFWNNWQSQSPSYVEFMEKNFRPNFTYADFASMFTAELFDPNQWADVLKKSGAKYLVLTSKHHEGFTLWPSKVSWNWNAVDVGPKRDLVGDLAAAVRKNTDIHFGVYHSMFEWYNPLYQMDRNNSWGSQYFVDAKTMPELVELVENYQPEVIWSDGDWEAPDTYWKSTEFLAWLYNDSPVKDTVVVNDRWGSDMPCHHGGYYTCTDRYNPGTLQPHKWENCMTIDQKSWGFRREATLKDYLTIEQLIETLATTVSCNGNLLMNIGPTKDGRIVPIFEERLTQIGQWLAINGEAIYATKPWSYQNDTVTPRVWYTASKNTTSIYAIVLQWPAEGSLYLGAPVMIPNQQVTLLGYNGPTVPWRRDSPRGVWLDVSGIPQRELPSRWAWVFKFSLPNMERPKGLKMFTRL